MTNGKWQYTSCKGKLGVVSFLSHASTHTLPLMVPLATCCMHNTTTPIWISLDFFLCRIALWQISYFVNIERILPLKKFPCDIIITFLYWNDLPLRCNCANEPFLKLLPDSLTWLCFFLAPVLVFDQGVKGSRLPPF